MAPRQPLADIQFRDRLRAALDYCAESGRFTWRIARPNGVKPGAEAGANGSRGYRIISLDGQGYSAHRLAFVYMTGAWPTSEMVDHIDGDRSNNAWANLREATRSQNLANSAMCRRGKGARKGVSKAVSGWKATIQKDGVSRHLGFFPTVEQAGAAYDAAALDLFGSFAKGVAA